MKVAEKCEKVRNIKHQKINALESKLHIGFNTILYISLP